MKTQYYQSGRTFDDLFGLGVGCYTTKETLSLHHPLSVEGTGVDLELVQSRLGSSGLEGVKSSVMSRVRLRVYHHYPQPDTDVSRPGGP